MTNWLMKYNGEAVSDGRYKGFCIMTETDRCAYEKIVKTYFEERENTFLFIRKGAGILKIKTEQEFWKCI